MKKFIEGIMEEKFLSSFIIFILLIAPGFLITLYFNPTFFSSTDVYKLIILSLSFAVPLVVANDIVFGMMAVLKENNIVVRAVSGIFITSFVLIAGLVISYFNHLSFSDFINFEIIAEVVLFIGCQYTIIKDFNNSNPDLPENIKHPKNISDINKARKEFMKYFLKDKTQ